jgi:hypothetical protein
MDTFQNEDFHESHSSSEIIIRMIIPRRMRLAEHVARMEQLINMYKILVGNF